MEQNELTKLIRSVTEKVLLEHHRSNGDINEIPIAVSNRHIHLSEEHVDRLFGKGYTLRKLKDLSQPGQFASQETVSLIGPKGRIDRVRVLGPSRGNTQVEVSLFDGFTLGVTPPVRHSGHIEDTPPITIEGLKGQLTIKEGLICAARHIHMHPEDATRLNVSNGEVVQVKVCGKRGLIFDEVLVRVSPNYRLEMHIDLDEANAAQIKNGDTGLVIKK